MRPIVLQLTAALALATMSEVSRADTSGTQPYVALAAMASADSNVMNGSGPDLVSRISPEVGLVLKRPRVDLAARYRATYFDYALGKASNTWNQLAALDLSALPTERTTIEAHDTFVYALDPSADAELPALVSGGILDQRGTLRPSWRATPRLTIAPSYSMELVRYTTFPTYDGIDQKPALVAAWEATRRDELTIGDAEDFFHINFQDTSGIVHQPQVGWLHSFDERTDAQVAGGPAFYTSAGQSSVTWHALAQLRWFGPHLRLAAIYHRELLAGGAPWLLWGDAASVQVTTEITRRTAFRAYGVGYRYGVAPNGTTAIRGLALQADLDVSLRDDFVVGLFTILRTQDIAGNLVTPTVFAGASRAIAGVQILGSFGVDTRQLPEVP